MAASHFNRILLVIHRLIDKGTLKDDTIWHNSASTHPHILLKNYEKYREYNIVFFVIQEMFVISEKVLLNNVNVVVVLSKVKQDNLVCLKRIDRSEMLLQIILNYSHWECQ